MLTKRKLIVAVSSLLFMTLVFYTETFGSPSIWYQGRLVSGISFVEPNRLISSSEFGMTIWGISFMFHRLLKWWGRES